MLSGYYAADAAGKALGLETGVFIVLYAFHLSGVAGVGGNGLRTAHLTALCGKSGGEVTWVDDGYVDVEPAQFQA